MPLAFSPNATVDLWLDIDAETPRDKRPVFQAKYATEEEAQRMEALLKEQFSRDNDDDTCAKIREALAVAITGWKNMPQAGQFAGADSLKFLTTAEVRELYAKVWAATTSCAPFAKPSA